MTAATAVARTSTRRPLFVWLFLLAVALFNRSSRRRRNNLGLLSGLPVVEGRRSDLQYDRSVTTFSDNGRLLQVDYSTIAANDRGTVTMACLEVPNESKNAVIVGLVEDAATSSGSTHPYNSEQRLVFRVDDHCLLFITGLVGDGRCVASMVRQWCQNYRLQYGEAPTVAQIAQEALAKQWHHRLTLTAGARPLAVTAAIVGATTCGTKVELYRSEPGTLVAKPYDCCVSGKNRMMLLDELVQLQQVLEKESLSFAQDQSWQSRFAALKTKAVRGILSLLLLGKSEPNDNTATATTAKRAEIWVVEPCIGKRGNVRIQCVKGFTTGNLEETSHTSIRKLCHDDDDNNKNDENDDDDAH